MPTYTYACTDCDERFDAVQSIHDDALTDCPVCDGKVRRVISAVGVAFKGSGFYRTDSRGSSSGGSSGGSSSSGSATSKPAAAKSDAGSSGSATSAGASPA